MLHKSLDISRLQKDFQKKSNFLNIKKLFTKIINDAIINSTKPLSVNNGSVFRGFKN